MSRPGTFKKGHKKNGGRKKGTPNKITRDLFEKAEELGVNPFEILLRFAKGDWAGLGYNSPTKTISAGMGITIEVDQIDSEIRMQAAAKACEYLFPKRKSIDVTSDGHAVDFTSLAALAEKVSGSGKN